MRSLFFTTLLLAFSLSLFAGCTQTAEPANAVETVNTVCPIMGGKVAPDGGTAEWDGKVVGFCCPGCEPKWEALTDEQKAEKLAEAESGDHGDHDHS